MKKTMIWYLSIMLLIFSACKTEEIVQTYDVSVQLTVPSDFTGSLNEIPVKLASGSAVFEADTDADGKATFTVPVGIYEVTASLTHSQGGASYIFGWAATNIAVTNQWGTAAYSGGYSGGKTGTAVLTPQSSRASQIVIKELFAGGTPKDDGSGPWVYDKYVVLYNNSTTTANLNNLCLGMIAPFNAQASNPLYGTDGKLVYESQNWTPAVQGYWYFQQNVSIEPGKEIVVALNSAVNHTTTYSKSINFDNAKYYCTYDIEAYTNVTYYVSPAASIPVNHYLKAQRYASGNAWSLSVTSPGFFIFDTKGTTPAAFAADASTTFVPSLASYTSKKVPNDWIIDGVEGYLMNNANNQKRFTAAVDAGYVYHLNSMGYSIYRNVDKAATEGIADNAGKLVYNYSLGTVAVGGTTDPSGIDAEASIKKGARIIFKDTNNSTADFHLRSQAALRN